MLKIGFVGLGNMGSGMALNLVRAGHEVVAYDLSDTALAAARAGGCHVAASLAETGRDVTAVVTMLPAGRHVREVYEGTLFEVVAPGTLLIDCSTIDVAAARTVADGARARGLPFVDAPVSGGIVAARSATLTFMVGGQPEAFAKAEPILSTMGRAVIHAGAPGTGQASKICNNMILGATMIATCEAFLLAQKLGLDPSTFFQISSKASGQSWSMTSYCPVPGVGPKTPADNAYKGGFAAALMLKDLKLAVAAAQEANASVPMGSAAASLYQAMANAGAAGLDFSAMLQFLDGRLTASTAEA